MKSCGVIVEYNPFHNGHLYHIQQARKKTNADVIIAIMSGNFLQRGEPAIVDKWTRTQMALFNGADLVIELPVSFSVQPADFFAKGGIALLHSLGCQNFCFGAETGKTADYYELTDKLKHKKSEIEERFNELKNDGSSYAFQMDQIMKKLLPETQLNLSSPNTILGLAYAKENANYSNPMALVPIKRIEAEYHDKDIVENQKRASATAIRVELTNSLDQKNSLEILKEVMPESSQNLLSVAEWVTWENYWPFLKYQLINQSIKELQLIYEMKEGIEYRLKEKVKEAENFKDFISLVKNKRYTWVRLQRLCVYILLNMKKSEINPQLDSPKAIHLLGFNKIGQTYLNGVKKIVDLPILNHINKKNASLWELDIKAGDIYNLGYTNNMRQQDYRRQPIIIT
ncbi:Predicted nucleotidyltransferase [Carnobacterium iners]|uniref:tRNA(Met) cytidine acetate ligase n=1 Tax=Carnobacterium iners TaxID=1073423 RepID=A0A1X7NPT4_9LACT|nr:nucleotidyltransferase [Carnobacterium iners]SEK30147.1 Predicted nucleotidyltransferase [Carnobacterium iners]SMH39648.1 Predicted nucleotidyltransferase [Carnobacterium iners]